MEELSLLFVGGRGYASMSDLLESSNRMGLLESGKENLWLDAWMRLMALAAVPLALAAVLLSEIADCAPSRPGEPASG
jgi:hypothetical protein